MTIEVVSEAPISVNPNILSGTPVFPGTRVPVNALFDYIEGGLSLDVFLDHFPTVSREKALEVITWAREIVGHAHPVR
ncbi:MAG: DUF433 domain-containing protein [Gemmataceae bacterium]